MREDYRIPELTPETLQQIARFVEQAAGENQARTQVVKATGGQERILKLQLRAFERIPSEVIARYMTPEERQEYYVLIDAYA